MSIKFNTVKKITGYESRISKKTNKPYTLIYFLDDTGQTFNTIAECSIPEGIKQLDEVKVGFELQLGKYMQLKTISMELVK